MGLTISIVVFLVGLYLGMGCSFLPIYETIKQVILLSLDIGDIAALLTGFVGVIAYYTYRKQTEISDTTNLMTTWVEHNRIMGSINDSPNDKMKSLKYFELFMFFERICGLYYTEWKNSERIKKEFHVLYDETIDANCRKHFEKSFKDLYKNNRFIYEYGLTNIVRYLQNIDKKEIVDYIWNYKCSKRRRNIRHILPKKDFDIDKILDNLYNLYNSKSIGTFNHDFFNEYRKNIKIKHEK